jgi:hypothetical protein
VFQSFGSAWIPPEKKKIFWLRAQPLLHRLLHCFVGPERLAFHRLFERSKDVKLAKQAQEIFKFNTLKRRLHNTTAAIWFNKACRTKQLTPTYISIKIQPEGQEYDTSCYALPIHPRN